jgi:cytochrome P450
MTTETAEYRLPPGPKTPKLLNGFAFLVARNAMIKRLQRRYGDAVTIEMPGFGQMVLVTRPDQVKQVYTAKPDVLHAGRNPLGEVLGHGSLFSMDEERHLRERRMLLPPFHGERMRSYEAIIEEEAKRAMAEWPEGVEFASIESFQTITLRIILRAVFGAEGRELAALEKLLPPMTTIGQRLVLAPILRRDFGRRSPGRRWRRMLAHYRVLVDKVIDDHLADPDLDERIDILAMMLRAQLEDGGVVDRPDTADELLTLLVAGHETTATSLSWAIERLARNPDKLERLRAEVLEGREEYLTATIQETLRLRPVISIVLRRLTEAVEIGGYELPAGVSVAPCVYLVHRNPEVYPEPQRFLPERFLERPPGTYTWIPFGGGVRRCLGASFAQFEMAVVLKELVKRHQIRPANPKPERVFRRAITETPRHNAEVILG